MNAETLIWAPVGAAIVIVAIAAIVMNLSPSKHEDVDALAEQAAERERERVRQINADQQRLAQRSRQALSGRGAN